MKTNLLLMLATVSLLCACSDEPEKEKTPDGGINESAIFQNKYYKTNVFDCSRQPADPTANEEWYLSSFITPYNAQTREALEWPEGGYLMFDILEDTDKMQTTSLIDDVENSGKTYKIQLKLYKADGTFVELVSEYGKFGGFGDAGFFYEQQEFYGTLFTNKGFQVGEELKYTPTTGYISKLSELIDYTTRPE